ncbi:MAG: flavin reductase [Candidatus Thermoplasmatota archaeon]|nr:flavin reductase [Candidatus Thermoplasmatota archaeon]
MNKKALQKISYGVYIICSEHKKKTNGQIANAVMQITADPPTIAVSINKDNYTHELITKSRKFTISILDKNIPMSLIGTFGFKCGRTIDKMQHVNCIHKETMIPIITDYTIAYIEAKLINHLDVGTHTIFIGEVENTDLLNNKEPMTYEFYHEIKGGLSPKNAPTYQGVQPIKESKKEEKTMDKYVCTVCGYVYDPEKGDPDNGVQPGTPFEQVSEEWVCPICGAEKDAFEKQ